MIKNVTKNKRHHKMIAVEIAENFEGFVIVQSRAFTGTLVNSSKSIFGY